jgi:hypothetical protein
VEAPEGIQDKIIFIFESDIKNDFSHFQKTAVSSTAWTENSII